MTRRRVDELVRRTQAGLDADTLRTEVLRRLRSVVTVDAAFFATVDPATLLFTSATVDEPLQAVTHLFLANEFAASDVNKFTDLARAPFAARSLDTATGHDRSKSARYREIMAPLGLGDELRVVLPAGPTVWGVLCLHREDSELGFSDDEVRLVQSIAPDIGAGLRHAVLLAHAQHQTPIDNVGIVVLDAATLSVASANAVGERMLAELRGPDLDRRSELPVAVRSIAGYALNSVSAGEPLAPSIRLCTSAGHWLRLHASVLGAPDGAQQIAIVIDPAGSHEIASLLLDAYNLTPRERQIAELVLSGHSTRQIVNALHISAHTIQDHLKSIFEKFGVGSRRELVGALLGRGSS
jgi:DNA-binding CsgD family transcriptional regulator